MSVTLDPQSGVIILEGNCGMEDSEALLGLLTLGEQPAVDWSKCTGLHTAVLQVLLAARPTVTGRPASPFLQRHFSPIFQVPEQ